MCIADAATSGAVDLSVGRFLPLYQSGIRTKLASFGKPVDIPNLIKNGQRQYVPHSPDALQQVKADRVVLFGQFHDLFIQLLDDWIVVINIYGSN